MKRLVCLCSIALFSATAWGQFVGSPTWFADTYRIAVDKAAARAAAERAAVAALPPGFDYVVFTYTDHVLPPQGLPDLQIVPAGSSAPLAVHPLDRTSFSADLKRGGTYQFQFSYRGKPFSCDAWSVPATGPKALRESITLERTKSCAPPGAEPRNPAPRPRFAAFDTSALPNPPRTAEQMSLWTMIRYAASPQDQAIVHRKLADYYAAHHHPRRAAAERARAAYGQKQN